MLTNLLTLLVPDSDNLLLYEAMIFLRSLPNTRRGAYLEGCSALVWASGVTPLFIIVDMINLNWLLFFIICAYYYILNLSYPFNIICLLIKIDLCLDHTLLFILIVEFSKLRKPVMIRKQTILTLRYIYNRYWFSA